jgi:hypothetical protein
MRTASITGQINEPTNTRMTIINAAVNAEPSTASNAGPSASLLLNEYSPCAMRLIAEVAESNDGLGFISERLAVILVISF